jgi:glutamyl-tRNA synthetase
VTRTALFNYLYARHLGGKFLIRIEDTDRERSQEEFTRSILEGLEWAGLTSDEPPIYQSQRTDYYRTLFEQILEEGKAYYCDCSKERLDQLRSGQQAAGKTPRYDNHCRDRSDVKPEGAVIRLKIPEYTGPDSNVLLIDRIYGLISFDLREIDDFVIAKSDGAPTYQFAVVADDHAQGVTIVIRGNDLLPSTPKQVLLYQALGWDPPDFAHLPMILGTDKQKLSKRHGATSLLAYRAMGYLPQAMCNYLVRLGWASGDQEVFRIEEMIEKFSLEAIGKSPAVFNPEKLLWLNGEHIRMLSVPQLTGAWLNHLEHLEADQVYLEASQGAAIPSVPDLDLLKAPQNRSWVEALVAACQERSTTLVQITEYARPFLSEVIEYDSKAVGKVLTAEARQPLEEIRGWIAANEPLPGEEEIHSVLVSLAERLNLGLGKVAQPIRVAVTGRTVSPPINTTLAILERSVGRPALLARIDRGLELISERENN